MILFGTAGIPASSKANTTIDGVLRVSELGLDAMEVEFVRGVNMGAELAKKVSKIAAGKNVKLSVHAPYYINLNGDKAVVAASRKRILDSARIAFHLGANVVVVHAAYYKNNVDKCTRNVMDSIKKFDDALSEEKNPVKIGLETMGKQSQWGTVDEIVSVCEGFNRAVPVVDWAHIHARGNGCLRTKEDFEAILNKIENLPSFRTAAAVGCGTKSPTYGGDCSLHCHWSDINYKNGNEKNHLPMGMGDINWGLLLDTLSGKKQTFTMICESPLLEVDALKLKKLLKVQ